MARVQRGLKMGRKGRGPAIQIMEGVAQITARHEGAQTIQRTARGERFEFGEHFTRCTKKNKHPVARIGIWCQGEIDKFRRLAITGQTRDTVTTQKQHRNT